MTQVELLALLTKQQQAYRSDPYPELSIRVDRLDRLSNMVVRHHDRLCEAVMADFGRRSVITTKASELLPIVDSCHYAKKRLPKWMKQQRRKTKFPLSLTGAKSFVVHQPLGVIGNISAWNFPVELSLGPIVDMMAAGNRIMLKPSELSSYTSSVLADIVQQNFDQEELAVVLGGSDVAKQFAALPFDHLLFTGSTYVGRLVAQAAAANLTPVTLELGGKNPVIVSDAADINLAAEKIMWAKTLNGGQICLSPDTVLIHESKLQDFIDSCQKSIDKMYPKLSENADFTHIISDHHAQRLADMVEQANNEGSKVIALAQGENQCVAPCLILDPKLDSKVMTEEVFGGPLPIVTYNDIQQALDFINDRPKPLALYYFGDNPSEIRRVTNETSSGGMVVNDCMAHYIQEDLPFGGVGDSGMGGYHGYEGFKNFSHARAVHKQSKLDPLRLVRPPYGKGLRRYIDKQFK